MKNKRTLSIRELTETIRNCQSQKEIEHIISNIQAGFDSFPISDQAFLLALIGVTLMTVTANADPLSIHSSEMHLSQLLRINWRDGKK